MSDPRRSPVASTADFFEEYPTLRNQYTEDAALHRASSLFLPKQLREDLAPGLKEWGDRVLDREVWSHVVDAEHDIQYISGSGYSSVVETAGESLVTSPGWKALQDISIAEGRIVATGNDEQYGPYARLVQLSRLHLWTGSAAVVNCPSATQDGAISILHRDLASGYVSAQYDSDALRSSRKAVFKRAIERMMSTDPAVTWSSGQWMRERAGGTGVLGTDTVAERVGPTDETDIDGLPLGPWSLSGVKWFSSATDYGCIMLLAQTERGLSCFFAPSRKLVDGATTMNGIRTQRVKSKLGTNGLPMAELEIKGMRAWLVGEEGHGVPIISTILNITRYYHVVGSVAGVGRALGVVKAFARVRPKMRGEDETLSKIPLFNKTLAGVILTYRADVFLSHLTAALLGSVDVNCSFVGDGDEHSPLVPSTPEKAQMLLHILTPVAKAYTAKHAVWAIQECMESLGGVGYLENVENPELDLARALRDANVNAIWEGTTNALASNLVRAIKGPGGSAMGRAVDGWLNESLRSCNKFEVEKAAIMKAWGKLRSEYSRDKDELLARGREILWRHGDIFCATLLVVDADRDDDPIATECAHRFVRSKSTFAVGPVDADWREVSTWDERIVYAEPPPGEDASRAHL